MRWNGCVLRMHKDGVTEKGLFVKLRAKFPKGRQRTRCEQEVRKDVAQNVGIM
jgi:hypothetical protein